MLLDAMHASARVAYGLEKEDQIRECLNTHYGHLGYDLLPSSQYEDTNEKTDCWQKGKADKRLRSAIKVRVSKNDILVALRDPFYGFEHEDTKVGRDVLYEYFQYITLSKDEELIRVASGKVIHKISLDLIQEILDTIGDINIKKSPYNKGVPVKVLSSEKHSNCEVWLHYDRKSGRPKLLGFIPPALLKENKEIKYHKFIREQKNELATK